jgi:hypothetical protein
MIGSKSKNDRVVSRISKKYGLDKFQIQNIKSSFVYHVTRIVWAFEYFCGIHSFT